MSKLLTYMTDAFTIRYEWYIFIFIDLSKMQVRFLYSLNHYRRTEMTVLEKFFENIWLWFWGLIQSLYLWSFPRANTSAAQVNECYRCDGWESQILDWPYLSPEDPELSALGVSKLWAFVCFARVELLVWEGGACKAKRLVWCVSLPSCCISSHTVAGL